MKAVLSNSVSRFFGLKKINLVAALFVLAWVAGCGKDEGASGARPAASPAARESAQALPELKVTEDEVMIDGPQALIGGTVENTTGVRLENVVLELELNGRDGGREVMLVSPEPDTLSPGEAAQYSLSVSNHDWSKSKIIRIRSSSRPDEELAFSSQRGAKRPPERLKPTTKVIVQRPPRPKGEEFINTPDSADPIP
jgi:hypothetical protein